MFEVVAVIVVVVVLGVAVVAYRNRSEKGIESGISSFRRELRALAPESDEGPRRARPPVDPPRTSGVGVLRPDPEAEPPPDDEPAPRDGDDSDGGSDESRPD